MPRRDPPEPDEVMREMMRKSTWTDLPVMGPKDIPVSFMLNRPLQRREESGDASDPDARIEPRSLPKPKYAPPRRVELPPNPLENITRTVGGRKFIFLLGEWNEMSWEVHPGKQSKYPKAVPVPNLTKKSRGRSVPTKDMGVRTGRTYTCTAEGCRKVFQRSEHLRRHTRSVHTHEKPYFCGFPFCNKTFTRKDNTIQHERTHTLYQEFFDCAENVEGVRMPLLLEEGEEALDTRETVMISDLPPCPLLLAPPVTPENAIKFVFEFCEPRRIPAPPSTHNLNPTALDIFGQPSAVSEPPGDPQPVVYRAPNPYDYMLELTDELLNPEYIPPIPLALIQGRHLL